MADTTIQRLLVELGLDDKLTAPLQQAVGNLNKVTSLNVVGRDETGKIRELAANIETTDGLMKRTTVTMDKTNQIIGTQTDSVKELNQPWKNLRFELLSAGLLFMQLGQQMNTLNAVGKRMTTDIGFLVLQYSLLGGQLPALLFLTDAQIRLGEAIQGLPQPIQDVIGAFTVFGEQALNLLSQLSLILFAAPQISKFLGEWGSKGFLAASGLSSVGTAFGNTNTAATSALGGISGAFTKLGEKIGLTQAQMATFGAMAGPIFIAIAAIALLSAAIIARAWGGMQKANELNNEATLAAMEGDWETWRAKTLVADEIYWHSIRSAALQTFNDIGLGITEFFTIGVLSALGEFAKAVLGLIKSLAFSIEKTFKIDIGAKAIQQSILDIDKFISTEKLKFKGGKLLFEQQREQNLRMQTSDRLAELAKGGLIDLEHLFGATPKDQIGDLLVSLRKAGFNQDEINAAANKNANKQPPTVNIINNINIDELNTDSQAKVDEIARKIAEIQHREYRSLA